MAMLTPFQTVGPYLSIGLRAGTEELPATGRIVIRGRLIDGGGAGIPDGVLEWWHPSLPSIQRSLTTTDGAFVVETIKAPHLAIRVLGRGILTHYMTRVYFADDPATAGDPILGLVPEHRRHTLIARSGPANEYRFDVVVQGDNETVFFDI